MSWAATPHSTSGREGITAPIIAAAPPRRQGDTCIPSWSRTQPCWHQQSPLASRRLRTMLETFNVSSTTWPADLAIAVVALWSRSFRTLTVRACSLRRLLYSFSCQGRRRS